jgi:protein-S-isoprenylcysteine O-methyltransferase Ste14
MIILLNILGLFLTIATLIAILWSIVKPNLRMWPPQSYSLWTPIIVWVPTFTIFGCLIGLGILGWGDFPISNWLRFGIGIPLIIIGNVAVWYEVGKFGIDQTGGAVGSLKTNGLYQYSRNPQYVADTTMVIGWLLLSASTYALPTGIMAILVLLVAPFAEEPWLAETYGNSYTSYTKKVRRYL